MNEESQFDSIPMLLLQQVIYQATLKSLLGVSLHSASTLLLHFKLHLCFFEFDGIWFIRSFNKVEEDDRAPGVLVYLRGSKLNVTLFQFLISVLSAIFNWPKLNSLMNLRIFIDFLS